MLIAAAGGAVSCRGRWTLLSGFKVRAALEILSPPTLPLLSAPVTHFWVGQPRTASGRQAARKSVRRGWAFLGRAVGLAGGLMTLQVLSSKIFTSGLWKSGVLWLRGYGLQAGAFSIMALLGEISHSPPPWSWADPNGSPCPHTILSKESPEGSESCTVLGASHTCLLKWKLIHFKLNTEGGG